MPTILACPKCQRKLQVPDDLAGQNVQCPTCLATFVAQAESGPPSAPVPGTSQQPPEARPAERGNRGDWGDEDEGYDRDDARVRRRRRDLQPHRGTMILVLGILALVLGGLGLILGPIAWILGNGDLRAIRGGKMDPDGEGLTNAGRICGIIATILGAMGLVLGCVWFALVVFLISSGSQKF